jgi:adenylate kinase
MLDVSENEEGTALDREPPRSNISELVPRRARRPMALNLMLMGPPGAGKGTQASRLARGFRVPHIATGDILREAVEAGSPLGRAAAAIMDAGQLVGDDIVIGIVRDRLERPDAATGFVLDGFPRTVAQAEALDDVLRRKSRRLDAVIEMAVDDGVLVERISGRFSCANCGAGYHRQFRPTAEEGVCDRCGSTEFEQRPDDNEETVKTRLAAYHAQTEPLLPYYRDRGVLKTVNGMAAIDEVTAQIDTALGTLGG